MVVLSVDPVADGTGDAPLEQPGTVRRTADGLVAASADGWLRIVTVEQDGHEVPLPETGFPVREGVTLGAAARA